MQVENFRLDAVNFQKFSQRLIALKQKKVSGTLSIEAQISKSKTRTRIIILQNGEIIYAGVAIPDVTEYARRIGKKFKPNLINVALNVAQQRALSPNSIREILDLCVKMRVLTWREIEQYVQSQVVLTLEQLYPYPCQLSLNTSVSFDLSFGDNHHGLDMSRVLRNVRARREEWIALQDYIPSMDAVPRLPINLDHITDDNVRQHLQKLVDGHTSLIEIAQRVDQDPLQVARSYVNWAQVNWVNFEQQNIPQLENALKNVAGSLVPDLPTVLTVDDSPTIQNVIKLALTDHYNVLTAKNAIEGLKILNQQQIDLLLLDVNMPGIDGLKMCKTLRNMPKFKDLPIVMLTAKDTRVDKMKGQIAGSNYYLHKPFNNDDLLNVVNRYLGTVNIPVSA